MRTWMPAGIAFLVAGLLEVLFLALSLLGVVVGGVMSVGAVMGELRHEEALIGPLVLIFYGLWFCVTAMAGPLHIVAGGMILAGSRNRKVLWAATAVSLLPVATVYCAPTSIIAGVIGLVVAVSTKDEVRG